MKINSENFLSAEALSRCLSHSLPLPIVEACVASTNTALKCLAEDGARHGQLFIADRQSAGRGRVGKSFYSPEGGLYMSLLLRPDMSAEDSLLITTCAAVAASDAIEEVIGKSIGIKWVNDLFADGKKVCGILTEAPFDLETHRVKYAILGIGINVFAPRDGFGDLENIAGALLPYSADTAEVKARLAAAVTDKFLDRYEKLTSRDFFDEYKRRLFILGGEIYVLRGEETVKARVLDLESDFSLTVEYENGHIERLTSGEISIISAGNS